MTTVPSFPSPPGGIFYHYTTRAAAQEMSIAGAILPGASGLIYLTDVLYRLGWQATDRLAIPQRNAEVAIAIPFADLPRDDAGDPASSILGSWIPGPPCRVVPYGVGVDTGGLCGSQSPCMSCPGHGPCWSGPDDA